MVCCCLTGSPRAQKLSTDQETVQKILNAITKSLQDNRQSPASMKALAQHLEDLSKEVKKGALPNSISDSLHKLSVKAGSPKSNVAYIEALTKTIAAKEREPEGPFWQLLANAIMEATKPASPPSAQKTGGPPVASGTSAPETRGPGPTAPIPAKNNPAPTSPAKNGPAPMAPALKPAASGSAAAGPSTAPSVPAVTKKPEAPLKSILKGPSTCAKYSSGKPIALV